MARVFQHGKQDQRRRHHNQGGQDRSASQRRKLRVPPVYFTSDMADPAVEGKETHCLIGPKPLSWYPVAPVDSDEETEARTAWGRRWLPLASSPFPQPDPEPIRVGLPLDFLQLQRFDDRFERHPSNIID